MKLPRKRTAACVAAFGLLAAGPADAYRVFLDHDTDGDLTTFRNVVEGSLTTQVTIVVVLGPEDADLDYLPFSLSWQCRESLAGTRAQGRIDQEDATLPVAPPFEDPMMTACTARTCACEARRDFGSPIAPREPGSYRFAVLPFARDATFGTVDFEVTCEGCSYEFGDAARATMTFTTSVIIDAASWGRVKSDYRR